MRLVKGQKQALTSLAKFCQASSGHPARKVNDGGSYVIITKRIRAKASRPADGYTPLHVAASLDYHELCLAIVRGGARVGRGVFHLRDRAL